MTTPHAVKLNVFWGRSCQPKVARRTWRALSNNSQELQEGCHVYRVVSLVCMKDSKSWLCPLFLVCPHDHNLKLLHLEAAGRKSAKHLAVFTLTESWQGCTPPLLKKMPQRLQMNFPQIKAEGQWYCYQTMSCLVCLPWKSFPPTPRKCCQKMTAPTLTKSTIGIAVMVWRGGGHGTTL